MTHTNQNKTVLVVGATGATGRLVIQQLLELGVQVRAIARPDTPLPQQLNEQQGLDVIRADLLTLDQSETAGLISGCDAVVSCLGHNLTWRGVFGKPHRLVRDAVSKLANSAIAGPQENSIKFILMNSAGCQNHDVAETLSRAHRIVVALIRALVPPHADNEQAADYLRKSIGQSNPAMAWVVVRPDSLKDEESVSDYSVHPSPIRSAIFDPGSTSRINVAHFMADLIADDQSWRKWEGQMPVIYNE